jgi:hypothetical protein
MLVAFTRDKDTKNTVRFTAAIGGEVSGSIYIRKDSELATKSEIVLEILEKHSAELQETA